MILSITRSKIGLSIEIFVFVSLYAISFVFDTPMSRLLSGFCILIAPSVYAFTLYKISSREDLVVDFKPTSSIGVFRVFIVAHFVFGVILSIFPIIQFGFIGKSVALSLMYFLVSVCLTICLLVKIRMIQGSVKGVNRPGLIGG